MSPDVPSLDAVSRPAVLVAMSGGVDSSLAAALLVEQGYAVSGVTMLLGGGEDGVAPAPTSCCSWEAAAGACQVCRGLGIPHEVLDLRADFAASVVDEFIREYAGGRTPNPCLACNRAIKFGVLLERARAWGFDFLATGHYARVVAGPAGRYRLLRGRDRRKDQGYVLYMLGPKELAQTLLPLGELTKAQVRAEAARRGLPTAGRPESQEICFLPDADYRRFVAQRCPESVRPGPIRDREGRLLGTHRGLPYYTVGQRQGLGGGRPAPLFVLALDVAANTLIVGPEEALLRTALEARQVTFVAGEWPAAPLRVEAQVRYRAPAAPATLEPLAGQTIRLTFEAPQRAITPGQAVVFYQGEEVLGGGTIC